MIIGIDIDDVLNNLTESVLTVYRQDTGHQLFLNDIKEYNMTPFIKKEYQDTFFKYFGDKRVWDIIQPIYEGFDCIIDLWDKCHEIYFVTATHPLNLASKYEWLQKFIPFDPYRNLIVACDKSRIRLDILIDDCAEHFLPYHHGYLMHKPWNEGWEDMLKEQVRPVNDWYEIRDHLQKGGLL